MLNLAAHLPAQPHAPRQIDSHSDKSVGNVAVYAGSQSQRVVELGQLGPQVSGHLKLEVQPSLELPGPVQRTGREVLGLDGYVQLLEDALEGSIALGLFLDLKGQLAEVCKGSLSVSPLVVVVGLREGQAGRGGTRDGLVGGEAGHQVRCRTRRQGGRGPFMAGADVFVHRGFRRRCARLRNWQRKRGVRGSRGGSREGRDFARSRSSGQRPWRFKDGDGR